MKKSIIMTTLLVLYGAFFLFNAIPVTAKNIVSGKIVGLSGHTHLTNEGVLTNAYGANVGEVYGVFVLQNMDDHDITFHVEFYDANGQLYPCKYPAEPNEITTPAHAVTPIWTTQMVDCVPENSYCTFVIVWSGPVDIPPRLIEQAIWKSKPDPVTGEKNLLQVNSLIQE